MFDTLLFLFLLSFSSFPRSFSFMLELLSFFLACFLLPHFFFPFFLILPCMPFSLFFLFLRLHHLLLSLLHSPLLCPLSVVSHPSAPYRFLFSSSSFYFSIFFYAYRFLASLFLILFITAFLCALGVSVYVCVCLCLFIFASAARAFSVYVYVCGVSFCCLSIDVQSLSWPSSTMQTPPSTTFSLRRDVISLRLNAAGCGRW